MTLNATWDTGLDPALGKKNAFTFYDKRKKTKQNRGLLIG